MKQLGLEILNSIGPIGKDLAVWMPELIETGSEQMACALWSLLGLRARELAVEFRKSLKAR